MTGKWWSDQARKFCSKKQITSLRKIHNGCGCLYFAVLLLFLAFMMSKSWEVSYTGTHKLWSIFVMIANTISISEKSVYTCAKEERKRLPSLAFSSTGESLPAHFTWASSQSHAGRLQCLLIWIGFKLADQRWSDLLSFTSSLNSFNSCILSFLDLIIFVTQCVCG